MKPWLKYLLTALGGLALGIVIAKYTLPPRIEERERVVVKEVEVVKWKDREVVVEGPVRVTTKTVTVPGPAGPTVTVEKIVEKEKVVTVHTQGKDTNTTTYVERETEKVTDSRPWLALEAMGAIAPTTGSWAWSGGVQFRALGPVWIGAGVLKADTWYVGPMARWEF
jgi:hypothetical protein